VGESGPYIAMHGNQPSNPAKPISLELDKRKYVFPAAFRSGDCPVRVFAESPNIDRPSHPSFESDFLFYKLWPMVKEVAPKAMNHCLAKAKGWGGARRAEYRF